MKNKYVNRSKISEAKFRELVRFYSLDLTALQIAELTGLNRNTVNRYLTEIRKKITGFTEAASPVSILPPSIKVVEEVDQYLILIKEEGTEIFTDVINKSNHYVIRQIEGQYDLVIDMETGKHQYIGGDKNHRDSSRRKLNRIKSFWGNVKSRLSKFKGIHASTFRLHLKECEFRHNNRNEDLYQLLLKILRNNPLF